MAFSLNRVQLIGNLGRDPEMRYTQDGRAIAQLSIATSESWNDQQGQRQEKTEWHRVVIFGKLAEIAQQHLRKGSKVFLEGQLQTRKWQDQGGQERYTTEVVISGFQGNLITLDGRPGGGGGAGGYAEAGGGYAEPAYSPPGGGYAPKSNSYVRAAPAPAPAASQPAEVQQIPPFDDDIPF